MLNPEIPLENAGQVCKVIPWRAYVPDYIYIDDKRKQSAVHASLRNEHLEERKPALINGVKC